MIYPFMLPMYINRTSTTFSLEIPPLSSILNVSNLVKHLVTHIFLPTCCRCLCCPRMFVFIEIWEDTKNLPDSFPFDSDLFFFSPSLTHAHTQPYSIFVLSSFQLRAYRSFTKKESSSSTFIVLFFLLITSQSLFPFFVTSFLFSSSSINPLLVVLFHFRGSFFPLSTFAYQLFLHPHTVTNTCESSFKCARKVDQSVRCTAATATTMTKATKMKKKKQ